MKSSCGRITKPDTQPVLHISCTIYLVLVFKADLHRRLKSVWTQTLRACTHTSPYLHGTRHNRLEKKQPFVPQHAIKHGDRYRPSCCLHRRNNQLFIRSPNYSEQMCPSAQRMVLYIPVPPGNTLLSARTSLDRKAFPSTFLLFCLVPSQELAGMDSVAPFICGAAVAEGPVAPGGTWRGTLMVDDSICPDPVYSVVTMLGELWWSPSRAYSISRRCQETER